MRQFEDCFFTLAAATGDPSRLRGQLEAAHQASGFTPRQVPGLYNDVTQFNAIEHRNRQLRPNLQLFELPRLSYGPI
jgi:hypothetical protein